MRLRYVSTATDEPPSASEDSNSDGYLSTISERQQKEASLNSQKLLEEQNLKMVD